MASSGGTELEIALEKIGTFGKFHYELLFRMIPSSASGIIVVNSVTFILPAIICEFNMSSYQQGLLFSAVYMGMVCGGLLWGVMTDVIGRRNTLLLLLGVTFIFEMGTCLTFHYWQLFLLKVCSGFMCTGIMTTSYAYVSEFIQTSEKAKMTVRIGMATSMGYLLQPAIAIFTLPRYFRYTIIPNFLILNGWKTFQLICGMFPLVGFLIVHYTLDESPAFLLRMGRAEEALKVLKKVYVKNTGKKPETFNVKNLQLKEGTDEPEEKTSFIDQLALLLCGRYTPNLIVCVLCQFITMGAFAGIRGHLATIITLSLGIGQAKGVDYTNLNYTFCELFDSQKIFSTSPDCVDANVKLVPEIYMYTTVIGLLIVLAFIPVGTLVQKLGDHFSFLILHYIGGAAVLFIPFSHKYVVITLLTIFAVAMQTNLTLGVSLIIRRVPTTIRGVTISILLIGGRIGVIVGSMILPVMTTFSCQIGFWSISALNSLALPLILIYLLIRNPLKSETS